MSNQPENITLIDLTLETPDGTLKGRMAVPAGEMRLAELAFNIMPVIDQITGLAVKREQQEQRPISCRAGCGACCRQVVPLSAPEAWMYHELTAGLRADHRARVLERFDHGARLLTERGFGERFSRKLETDKETRELGRDYFALGLACPFLEAESCSIHPVRPSICREYLVTSPAELCRDPYHETIQRVSVPVRASLALARLSAELLGNDIRLIPLTMALRWAEEHRAEGQRQWDGRFLVERLFFLLNRR